MTRTVKMQYSENRQMEQNEKRILSQIRNSVFFLLLQNDDKMQMYEREKERLRKNSM